MIVCAEMDEQWAYVGAKSRQRAGCFTRMTQDTEDGCGARPSVNAPGHTGASSGACCRP